MLSGNVQHNMLCMQATKPMCTYTVTHT